MHRTINVLSDVKNGIATYQAVARCGASVVFACRVVLSYILAEQLLVRLFNRFQQVLSKLASFAVGVGWWQV